MKYNKNASGKTVETSINDAPQITRREHIPPIEIFSGSVILETVEEVGNNITSTDVQGYPRKHVFDISKQIEYVRVIMFNGSRPSVIDDEYPLDQGGKIEIWVKEPTSSTTMPNMVFETGPGPSGKLQVEIDNENHKFSNDQSGGTPSHPKKRWTYNEPDTKLWKVRISRADGTSAQVSTDQIVLIQIWPK